MTGRGEVHRLQTRLDATFKRAKSVAGDAEVQSDLARHLCVLVSGFLEQAVIELAIEHARQAASPRVQKYVEQRLRGLHSMNSEALLQVVGAFDTDWYKLLGGYLVDERKAAVDSVVSLRHRIAHGQNATVTLVQVQEYYEEVKRVVAYIADLYVPTA